MKRNNWIWLGLLGMVLVVSAGWYWFHNQSANTSDQEQASIGKTATLYLHGYSGGAGSTNTLIRHAKQAGATKVLTATVTKNGKSVGLERLIMFVSQLCRWSLKTIAIRML